MSDGRELAEEVADLKRRLRGERIESEHVELNRVGASVQADGMAKALVTVARERDEYAVDAERKRLDRDRWRDLAKRLAGALRMILMDDGHMRDCWRANRCSPECVVVLAALAEYVRADGEADR